MTLPTFTKEAPPSLFEDLFEIFYAPRAVFERRRETPAFGLALLVLVLLLVGLTFAFQGLMEPVFELEFKRGMARAMAKNPQITEANVQQSLAFFKKFLIFGVAIYAIFTPLILGLALWGVNKLLEGTAQLGQAIMVATYAQLPRVLESVLNAVQMLVLPDEAITGRYSTSLGVGRFLDPDHTSLFLMGALGRIDLFTLWVTVLLALGIGVMGRLPGSRVLIAGVLMWFVGLVPVLWGVINS